MNIKSLEKKDDQIIFTGEVLDIYLPTANFDRKNSSYNGQYIRTIGVFAFEIKSKKVAKEGGHGTFHTFKFPNQIEFEYSESYKYTGTLDDGKISKDTYNVFRLTNGDIFIRSLTQPQSSNDAMKFIEALHGGQIPESIPYDNLLDLYLSTINFNKINLKSSAVVLELILSELCRDEKDLTKSFRLAIANKTTYNPFAYQSINLTQIPSLNNTFSALAFQDFDNSIINGINRNLNGEEDKESPIEKIIKY